jgi:membrane-associated phospholipid phosphatase
MRWITRQGILSAGLVVTRKWRLLLWGWLALQVENYWLKASLWTIGVLICMSRIYLGVHDVGDVLGGIMLGAVTLYIWVELDVANRLITALETFGLTRL